MIITNNKDGFQGILTSIRAGDRSDVERLVAGDSSHLTGTDPYYRHYTPLHWASQLAHAKTVSVVEFLLGEGADAAAADDFGATPLHMACMYGSEASVVTLLEHGADANARDKQGQTPLHYLGTYSALIPIAQALMRHGADCGLTDGTETAPLEWISRHYGWSQQAWASQGILANFLVNEGVQPTVFTLIDLDMVEELSALLNETPEAANRVNGVGETPLIRATKRGYQTAVDVLVPLTDSINHRDQDGWTAMTAAYVMGNWTINRDHSFVDQFIEAGAVYDEFVRALRLPDDVDQELFTAATPRQLRIWESFFTCCRCDLTWCTREKGVLAKVLTRYAPLFSTAAKMRTRMVLQWLGRDEESDAFVDEFVKEAKANPQIIHETESGCSLMQLATIVNWEKMVHALRDLGCPVDVMSAAAAGWQDELRTILANDPDQVYCRFADHTALNMANDDCFKILIDAGADINNPGQLKFWWGVQRPPAIVVDTTLRDICDEVDGTRASIIAAHRPNVDMRQQIGATVLGWAARNGTLDGARWLLERGADVAQTDFFGAEPLIRAVIWNKQEMVALLIDRGADPNRCTWHTDHKGEPTSPTIFAKNYNPEMHKFIEDTCNTVLEGTT